MTDERWLSATWPFVRDHLPVLPARVVELGCGPLGGFVPRMRLLGFVPISRTAAVALVYGAALGGWGYLVAWGALRAAGVTGAARPAGLAIGAAFGVLIAFEIVRLERSG